MHRIFRNLINKIKYNKIHNTNFSRMHYKKGVSLAEILVSVSIFSIIVIPFLGTFLSATKNNVVSKDKLYTSTLAQKAMDDIKSRPLLLSAEAGKGPKIYTNEGFYRVEYTIEQLKQGALPTSSTNYEFDLNKVEFCQVFQVGETNFEFNGSQYNLMNGIKLKSYYLNIDKNDATGVYTYSIYEDINNILQSGQIVATSDINEKIIVSGNTSDKFELNIIIADDVDKNVNVYTVDDTYSRVILKNNGNISFNQFYYANSGQLDYSNILYQIDVKVYKGTEMVNNILSYSNK